MKIFRLSLRVALGLAIVLTAPAFAYTDFGRGKPIVFQDLPGKRFCWDSGISVRFGADGQFLNNRGGHGTWTVLEPGVVLLRGQRHAQWEMLPDGRIHAYRYCLRCGDHDIDRWATPCN